MDCKVLNNLWNLTLAFVILYFFTLFPGMYFAYKFKVEEVEGNSYKSPDANTNNLG
jgi:hypothetical protein